MAELKTGNRSSNIPEDWESNGTYRGVGTRDFLAGESPEATLFDFFFYRVIKALTDLDSAIQFGTLASRPAASSDNQNYLYYANDDRGGVFYRSNGTSWEQVTIKQAVDTIYNNSGSTLSSTDVRSALDELDSKKLNIDGSNQMIGELDMNKFGLINVDRIEIFQDTGTPYIDFKNNDVDNDGRIVLVDDNTIDVQGVDLKNKGTTVLLESVLSSLVKTDGSNAMTGNLDLSSNDIVNVDKLTSNTIETGTANVTGIEIKNTSGLPYIDFKNDNVQDFDMRIALESDNTLNILNGILEIEGSRVWDNSQVNYDFGTSGGIEIPIGGGYQIKHGNYNIGSSGTATIPFNPSAFPNSCLSVVAIGQSSGASDGRIFRIDNVTASNFEITNDAFVADRDATMSIRWIAVGY